MSKSRASIDVRTLIKAFVLALSLAFLAIGKPAHASADRQSFFGGGIGVEVLSKDGSGTGFYTQLLGGYNINSANGFGLHAGFSKIGGVGTRLIDFGAFYQLTDADSGIYGKFFLDGVYGSVDGGHLRHGINGSQTAFAPGIALGMLIPPAGDFHLTPELAYKVGLFDSAVNLIQATFNVIWDF